MVVSIFLWVSRVDNIKIRPRSLKIIIKEYVETAYVCMYIPTYVPMFLTDVKVHQQNTSIDNIRCA